MNNKKNRDNRSPWEKYVKKTVYRAQTRSLRKVVALALIVGLLVALVQGGWAAYNSRAASYAQLSVVYPEIADGKYPDGSRFSAYDMISRERIQEALDKLQADGKYTDYTAEEIAEQFDIHAYTTGSVAEDVSTLRSEGNNYSYFANEYRLTFTQPGKGVDYSTEFLDALMQVNLERVQTSFGGKESFTAMTQISDLSNLDYVEQVSTYHTRISIALQYLKSLNSKAGGFVSETTGKTLMELISCYEMLRNERLSQIQNFIEVSGLTKNRETLLNKLNVRLEEMQVSNNKFNDEAEINSYAAENYDQTFTENLIVVSTSNRAGLYQARPKTAYDTVINQYNTAVESAVNSQVKIDDLKRKIDLYGAVSVEEAEYTRLTEKCEQMIETVSTEYEALNKVAADTLDDYLADINESYISYKVEKCALFSMEMLANAALWGLAAAVLVFVIYAVCTAISDFGKACIKKCKLRRLNTYRDTLNMAK